MVFIEETLESETLYKGAIINLRRDKVTVKGGRTSYREIVEHSGGVLALAVTQGGKVPMIRQYRHAVGGVVFELPAGKLEPGEDPLEAAKRELREETGYAAERWEHAGAFYTSVGYTTEYLHVYFAEGLSAGETDFDENEAIDTELWALDDLYALIDSGGINDAKTLAALLMYRTR